MSEEIVAPLPENEHVTMYKKVTNTLYTGPEIRNVDGSIKAKDPFYFVEEELLEKVFGDTPLTDDEKKKYKFYKTNTTMFKGNFKFDTSNNRIMSLELLEGLIEINAKITEKLSADNVEAAEPPAAPTESVPAASTESVPAAPTESAAPPQSNGTGGGNLYRGGTGNVINCTFEFNITHCFDISGNIPPQQEDIIFGATGILDITDVIIKSPNVDTFQVKSIADMSISKIDDNEKEIFGMVVKNNEQRNANEFLKLLNNAVDKGASIQFLAAAVRHYKHNTNGIKEYLRNVESETNALKDAAPKLFKAIDAALKSTFTQRGGKKRRTMKRGGRKTRRKAQRSQRRRSGRLGKRMSRR